MKRVFKAIWVFIVTFVGVAGGIASIYAIRHDMISAIRDREFTQFVETVTKDTIFWIWIVLSIPVVGIVVLIHLNLRARGRVSFRKFLRRFNPVIFARVCIQIHNLEHIYQELVGIVMIRRNGHNIFLAEDFRDKLYEYLQQCKLILDLLTGSDNAVHVKLFEHRTDVSAGTVPLRQAVLRTYLRAPSRRECRLVDAQALRPRENTEVFRIIPGKDGYASTMLKTKDKLATARYRRCSGYNHVFADPEHFFLCNNIPRLVKQGRFFSTSTEYEKYYNSVGVFLINQHVAAGQTVNHEPAWGLFIVDSFDTGIYEKSITKYVVGYMAHRCHGLFEHANHVRVVKP